MAAGVTGGRGGGVGDWTRPPRRREKLRERQAEAGDKRKTGTREETHAWTWTRRVFYYYF